VRPRHDLIEITLRGMRFHALVGVLKHERDHAQPVEVDLTVWVRPAEQVLDYRRLYSRVSAALGAKELLYLEGIADSIVTQLLAEEPRVERVRLAIRKPHAAVGGPLDHAEVVVTRDRDA